MAPGLIPKTTSHDACVSPSPLLLSVPTTFTCQTVSKSPALCYEPHWPCVLRFDRLTIALPPIVPSAKKALAISLVDRYSVTAIQFATSLALARLLSPTEIGIFSVASVVAAAAHAVRDLGITNYLIQEQQLSTARIRTAQGLALLIGWSLAIVVALLAAPVAAFYANDGIRTVILVLALNFFLLPFGSVTSALLRRDLNFGALFRISLASTVTQSVVSLTLAAHGFGFLSLAWGGLAGTVVTIVATILNRPREQPWSPGLTDFRRILSKGTRFSSASLIAELGLGGPELIAARVIGFDAAGYLSKANGAAMMLHRVLTQAVLPVAVPLFAQRHRQGDNLAPILQSGLALTTGVSWPAFAVLAVGAEPIVVLLYGHQWSFAAMPLQILSFGVAASSIGALCATAATGVGCASLVLRVHLLIQPIKLVLCILGAIQYGLMGLAIGGVVGDIMLSLVFLAKTARVLNVPMLSVLAHIAKTSGVVTVIVAVLSALTFHLLGSTSPSISVACLSATGASAWLIAVIATRHEIVRHLRWGR